MRVLAVVFDVLTGILLLSTLICGAWIKAQPTADPGSIKFHMGISLLTAAFVVASLVIMTIAAYKVQS
jgi:hypothetical protein